MNTYFIIYTILLLLIIVVGMRGIRSSIDWNTELHAANNRVLQEIRNELEKLNKKDKSWD